MKPITREEKTQIQKLMAARRREIRSKDTREFPKFNPAVMLTSDYVTAYYALNANRVLKGWTCEPATNRTPPGLDLTIPDPVFEAIE